MTATKVQLDVYDGATALPMLTTVEPLYAEIFAEPPYLEGADDVAAFASSWPRFVGFPAFRLVIAQDDIEPVGFAFGFRRTTIPGSDDEMPSFFVMELAVRREWRRRSIARLLNNELLAGNEAPVTLTVRPEAEAAQAVYASWGFQRIGSDQPVADGPVYDVMLRL